jgi:tRNA A37 threonylcarbamoyladenosine synthetase subunit TsaC/SUA5/YrdC
MPTPLPYVVVATTQAAVNRAKHRPEDQPAGIVVADFAPVAAHLDLDRTAAGLAAWLCTDERLNVFVPTAPGAPAWLVQDGTDGTVGLMGSWPPELRGVLDTLGHLYVSSATVSKQEVATTAHGADAAFGGGLLVVDGDPLRTAGVPHGSATIVRVSPSGDLSVARRGVNDTGFTDGPAFLAELARRYALATERGRSRPRSPRR